MTSASAHKGGGGSQKLHKVADKQLSNIRGGGQKCKNKIVDGVYGSP